MLEATGDIWEWADENEANAVCVLTNMTVASEKLIMGGGQAREARDRFPMLPTYWGNLYKNMTANEISVVKYYETRDVYYDLVAFPTKIHPSDDSRLDLIDKSCFALRRMTELRGWTRVVLPRPGCGLGGLQWDDVRPELENILDDRFTVISNVQD